MNGAHSPLPAKVLAFSSKHFLGIPTTPFLTCFPWSNSCAEIWTILGIQDQGGVKTRNIHNKKLDSYSNFYILGFFFKEDLERAIIKHTSHTY